MQQECLLLIMALLVSEGLITACSAAAQSQSVSAEPAVQANSSQAAQMPKVTIKLTDDGFTTPADMPAGIVAVNISNSCTKFQEGGAAPG